MKYVVLFIMLVFVGKIVVGQSNQLRPMITSVIIDQNFIDTLTFTSKWDYPWYITSDDNGHFDSAVGDSINKSDTIHLYYTSNCITNHQGEHNVKYCDANLLNDTIQLVFMPELPAYASSLTVWINKSNFWSNFHAVYPMKIIGEKLLWTIKKQKLILNNTNYKVGDLVKGYIEIDFTETNISPKEKPFSQDFYFKGYFKTQLKMND